MTPKLSTFSARALSGKRKRRSPEETINLIAALLKKDPKITRKEVAEKLGYSYGYVDQRWRAACEAAGVKNVIVSQKGGRKGGQNLIGKRYGHLMVLADLGTDKNGRRHWLCRCDCGREAVRNTQQLTRGESPKCARWNHEILGKRFGLLVVKDFAGRRKKGGDALYLCQCDCGREITPAGSDLVRGEITSCGCARWGRDYVEGTKLSGLDAELRSDNPTGVTGVQPYRGKWKASITFKHKIYELGTYSNIEHAIGARRDAEELLFDPILVKYGHAPTDEAAWRAQVADAMRDIRRQHEDAEEAEKRLLRFLNSRTKTGRKKMKEESLLGMARACGIVADRLEDSGKISSPELVALIQAAEKNPFVGLAQLTAAANERGVDLAEVSGEVSRALAQVDPADEHDLTDAEQGRFIVAYTQAVNACKRGVTVSEAARQLGVGQTYIRKIIYEGKILATKPRGAWVIDQQSLESFAEKRKHNE